MGGKSYSHAQSVAFKIAIRWDIRFHEWFSSLNKLDPLTKLPTQLIPFFHLTPRHKEYRHSGIAAGLEGCLGAYAPQLGVRNIRGISVRSAIYELSVAPVHLARL